MLHNPHARILSMEEFRELQTEELDVDLSHLRMAHRADWIRLYLLRYFGGIWLDADCIVMRSLSPLLQSLSCCKCMAYYEPDGRIGGGVLGAPADTDHINEMYDRATVMVRSKDRFSWRAIMGANFQWVLKHRGRDGFLQLEAKLFYPVKPHHRKGGLLLEEGTDADFAATYTQNLFTAMLSHNIFPKRLRGMGREELMNSNLLLSYFFRRAMGQTRQ